MSETDEHAVYTLSNAATVPMDQRDRLNVKKLEEKIPENLRGVFELLISEAGSTKTLNGIRIQANPVLQALANLYTHSNNDTHAQHLMKYHDATRVMNITGDRFNMLLADSPHSNAVGKHSAAIKTGANARNGCAPSLTSYDLDRALGQPLTPTDRATLEKISAAIPADLHGFFICDLAPSDKIDGTLQINQMAMDAETAIKIISARTESQLGHPTRAHIIAREELLAIAKALPAAAQQRS